MAEGDPWCETGPRDPTLIGVYWGVILIWICNISLGTLGTYKIIKSKHCNIFGILYITISALFIISPPGFAFGIQAGWECWYKTFRPWEGTYMVGLAGYFYGLAILYLFFLLRLQNLYKSTGSALNKLILYVLIIGFIIQLITPILSVYYFLSGWNDFDRTWALRWFNVFVYTNVVCSIFILILFTKKILSLSQSSKTEVKKANEPKTDDVDKDDIPIEMQKVASKNNIEQETLSLAIRYTICAILAMISTNIVVIIGIIRSETPSLHDNLAMRGIHIWFHIADEMVNLICLYLQFPFGKLLYGKCCKGIDHCFQSCFVKMLNLNVKQDLFTTVEDTKNVESTKSNSTNNTVQIV